MVCLTNHIINNKKENKVILLYINDQNNIYMTKERLEFNVFGYYNYTDLKEKSITITVKEYLDTKTCNHTFNNEFFTIQEKKYIRLGMRQTITKENGNLFSYGIKLPKTPKNGLIIFTRTTIYSLNPDDKIKFNEIKGFISGKLEAHIDFNFLEKNIIWEEIRNPENEY